MMDFLTDLLGGLTRQLQWRKVTHEVDGQTYAVTAEGTLGAPVRDLAPQWDKPTFNVTTLSALVALYHAKMDDLGAEVGFHVADHLTVRLVALKADAFGRRHVFAEAKHTPDTPFKFGNYYSGPEDFLIPFRASF